MATVSLPAWSRTRRRNSYPLPKPPETVEMMLDYAAPWTEVPTGKHHTHFAENPDEAIVDWHSKRGLTAG